MPSRLSMRRRCSDSTAVVKAFCLVRRTERRVLSTLMVASVLFPFAADAVVEDEEEVEETIIESTESDEELEIEDIEIEEVEEDVEVPFAVIENVPVFPGCERGNNEKKRKCMSEKIAKFVQRKFNTDLAGDLGLTGRQRISVIFKIDKSGNVTGVRARAPHPRLEKEAQRVINLLPKMQPGKQRGKAVIVPYSLPIIFQVQD